jgi:iron-sulfur cluster repair protein YtfE (RIC family)
MANAIERATAELMVAAKDAKAAFKGLTGVFMHLMEEHGKVGALIKRVQATSDNSVRAELYATIRSELLAHERGELKVVYPVLAQYSETASIAAAHSLEASELEATIAEIDALTTGSANWTSAFDRLAHLVEQHVDREESDYFPKAQKALGKERTEELLFAFGAARKS